MYSRCTLDETWLAGAQLARLYGKKMYVGLSRVIEKDVPLLAHHNILAKDAPDSFMAHSLQAQLACNVYVDVPDNGGNLQIWEQDVTADEFDKLRGKSYGIEPEKLGAPTIEVNLESGDLVFFNSRKMHAVTASPDRARLSVTCFIGYTGCHEPLIFWS